MLGATVMVPFCLWLERFHVVAAILGGAVVYLAVILALGVRKDLGLFWPKPATVPQCDSTRAVRPG
jgi:hypothetical protein